MKQDTKLKKEKERKEEALILEKLKAAHHASLTKVIIFSHFSFFQFFFQFKINYSNIVFIVKPILVIQVVNSSEAATGGVL